MIHKNNGKPLDDPAAYKHLIGRPFNLTHPKPDLNYFVQQLSKLIFCFLFLCSVC